MCPEESLASHTARRLTRISIISSIYPIWKAIERVLKKSHGLVYFGLVSSRPR